jgi:alpha-beta hydrolase superfamily lysophospholipase
LYYQSWYPQGLPRAAIAIVHGLGAHSGLFDSAVQYFLTCGYAIFGFDLRGHGRSPGQRGYINAWSEFREDLDAFLQVLTEQEQQLPKFLWGHSLGGAIAADYLLQSPQAVRGAILTAPAVGQVGISPLKVALARLLSQFWPRFSLGTGIDPTTGTRDPEVLAADARDPLRHAQGTARLATEFMAIVQQIQARAPHWQVPLLILQGAADRVTPPNSSRAFFDRVTFPDREWHEYADGLHEIYKDINGSQVLADMSHWLDRHLTESSSALQN